MRRPLLLLLLPLLALVSGCERSDELETRTFAVHHLQPHQVDALLSPYVFHDRTEAPGVMSVADNAVTVRETEDNLGKIARVLEEYDRPPRRVRLRFQLIEANGVAESDAAVADVVSELRRLFRFEGYRLLGESVLAADQGQIEQAFPGTLWSLTVGDVAADSPGAVRLRGLRLWFDQSRVALETSVRVSAGQTLVLGNAPGPDGGTVILVVRAEEDPGARESAGS